MAHLNFRQLPSGKFLLISCIMSAGSGGLTTYEKPGSQ